MVKSRNANDAEKAVAVAEAKKGGEDTGATPQKKKSRKKNATAKGAGVEAKDEVDTKKAVETKKDENPVTEDSQTSNTQQRRVPNASKGTVEEGTVVVDNTEVVRANEKLNAGKTVEAKKDEEDMVTEGVQEGPKRKRRKRGKKNSTAKEAGGADTKEAVKTKKDKVPTITPTVRINPAPRAYPKGCRTIFVGSLPSDTTEEDVLTAFRSCGKVVDSGVRLVRNYHTKVFKGYGYVQFKKSEGAKSAVKRGQKLGIEVKGSACFIDYDEKALK